MMAARVHTTDMAMMWVGLWLITSVKLVAEVALMAGAGQWLVGLLAGSARESNPFWRVLSWVTAPAGALVMRVASAVGRPGLSASAQSRWVALLLLLLWICATAAKVSMCLALGSGACR